MKKIIPSLLVAFAVAFAARAETTAKLTNVHLCCDKCVKGVETAVGTVSGAKATADKNAGTVEIIAPDKATAQKAANALVAAGYFGSSSDVKLVPATATGEKVQAMKVSGVHLCCPKCVKAVDKAVKSVPGVTGDTATKGAESFEVTGNFNDQEVMKALQNAGFTGNAGK